MNLNSNIFYIYYFYTSKVYTPKVYRPKVYKSKVYIPDSNLNLNSNFLYIVFLYTNFSNFCFFKKILLCTVVGREEGEEEGGEVRGGIAYRGRGADLIAWAIAWRLIAH